MTETDTDEGHSWTAQTSDEIRQILDEREARQRGVPPGPSPAVAALQERRREQHAARIGDYWRSVWRSATEGARLTTAQTSKLADHIGELATEIGHTDEQVDRHDAMLGEWAIRPDTEAVAAQLQDEGRAIEEARQAEAERWQLLQQEHARIETELQRRSGQNSEAFTRNSATRARLRDLRRELEAAGCPVEILNRRADD